MEKREAWRKGIKLTPGAEPKLSPGMFPRLKQLVIDGPESCGFDTGVWDSKLVRKLIIARFGVDYSTSQVRRILRKHGFSVQYPKRVFARADQKAQKTWLLKEYPKIKKNHLYDQTGQLRARDYSPLSELGLP